jgi:carbonic anhydrase
MSDAAEAAFARLVDGHRRFIARAPASDAVHRPVPVSPQKPFAIVLACSDSRVPVERIFDQDFGDLFVIRVAGNIVAPSQLGSVEFAATTFGTRLVVVMGHTDCGAVTATIADVLGRKTIFSDNVRSIVDRIRPAVEGVLSDVKSTDSAALVRAAVQANVRVSLSQLRSGSDVLEALCAADEIHIVGAVYSVETGTVAFFDGAADQSERIYSRLRRNGGVGRMRNSTEPDRNFECPHCGAQCPCPYPEYLVREYAGRSVTRWCDACQRLFDVQVPRASN